MRRLAFPLLLGFFGVAVLMSLGIWQMQRLAWKEAILADIDSRIAADPVPLPQSDPAPYLPVQATGDLTGAEIHVLTSADNLGPGYRVIALFETGGRRIMADLGHIPLEAKREARTASGIMLTGNLHRPQEVDGWTPEPDMAANIWFARDVPAMAAVLGTEPLLLVVRDLSAPIPGVTPLPIQRAGIANDHLNYAITWFLLALVWAVMSGFLVYRNRRAQPRV